MGLSAWAPVFGVLLLAIGGHTEAPASQHRSQTSDLADVLLKAVELMDHGIQDFLKEQPAAMPEDSEHLKGSQQKALKVIHQISTNFHDLKEVVEKFKHRHENEVKGVEQKGQQCQTDKIELIKRSETCEYVLENLATKGSGNATGGAFSQKDWKELDQKASEAAATLTSENKILSSRVTDLETRTKEAERRMKDAENKANELGREHSTLEQQNGQLKADDEAMVKTVKQLVQKNKLQVADLQAQALQQAREEMTSQMKKREEELKQEIAGVQGQVAGAKADAVKWQKQMEQIKQKMLSMEKEKQVLNGDKVHLLGTLNSVLRQNTEYGNQLKMCSFNGTSAIPSLTDPGLSSSEQALVMASKPASEQSMSAVAAVAAAAETPMPEEKAPAEKELLDEKREPAPSFAQTADTPVRLPKEHHALNHWLSYHAPTPPDHQATARRSLLSSGGGDGDGDVLQQLQLLSLGWQNHRVKADTIE